MKMKRVLVTLVGVASIFVLTASQALAYDCFLPNKPVGAGSVVTVDLNTGEQTPNKPNPGTEDRPHGAFVTLTDGTDTVDVFIKVPPPGFGMGGIPLVPGAAKQEEKGRGCDGKGWDTLEACGIGH